MNILVTGGAGFIGSNIVDAYLELGNNVIIIDDLFTGRENNINKKSKFIKMDIRDKNLNKIFEKYKIDFVNHQAARGDVRGSVERPLEYADVNICGGINLLQCSIANKIKGFIYSSTGGCVYGEPKYVPTEETHAMQPRDPYGASKASLELYIETFKQLYGLEYTIFRYANIYGWRQNPYGEAGVISIFTLRMLKNMDVIINGDGKQERDYVFIKDVVKANILATHRNANTVLNIGSGIGTNVKTIFEELKRIIGYKKDSIYVPAKKGEVSRSILSAEKIKKLWNWNVDYKLEKGLELTVEYIRKNEV